MMDLKSLVPLAPGFEVAVMRATEPRLVVGEIYLVAHFGGGGGNYQLVGRFDGYVEFADAETHPTRLLINLFLKIDPWGRLDLESVAPALGRFLLDTGACAEPMHMDIHQTKNTSYLDFGKTWLDDDDGE